MYTLSKKATLRVMLVLFLIICVFLAAAAVVHFYDQQHKQTISCTVTTAEVKGKKDKEKSVWVHTQECGSLTIRNDLDTEGAHRIAGEFTPGQKYDFEVGEMAWYIRGLVGGLGEVKVYAYKPA